jgi:hypothetical protein
MQQHRADAVVVTVLPLPLWSEVVWNAAEAQLLKDGRHGFSGVIGDITDD